MPDLHGWITQQIDRVELVARRASADLGAVLNQIDYQDDAVTADEQHIMDHDPANVLRRCAADRKILERHHLTPRAIWYEAAKCEGCGTEGEMGYPVTENLNDCPELLDLADAHGLTPEILATLDRPQEGERPAYPGKSGSVIGDMIASLYADLYKGLLASTFAAAEAERLVTGDGTGAPLGFFTMTDVPEPTPGERAFAILEPHLADVPLYRPRGRLLR